MKAYVLTEDQMRAYWALERRAARPDLYLRLADEVKAVVTANDAADELTVEGAARVAAERLSQPGRGWTAEHDRGHEAELIVAAMSYVAVAADVHELGGEGPTRLTAADVDFPWPEHNFRPRPTTIGNLDKAAALLIAAADTIEAGQ